MQMKKKTDYIFNPLLFFGVGLFPALIICYSLKSAVVFGALLVAEIILINLVISGFKSLVIRQVRIPIYVLISLSVIYFIDSLAYNLLPNLYADSWSVVQILFTTTVTLFICEYTSTELKLSASILVSLRVVLAYVVVLILLGAMVEVLGYGQIWGIALGFEGIPFFASFAGIVLMLAIMALLYNVIATYFVKRRILFETLVDRYVQYLETVHGSSPKRGGM